MGLDKIEELQDQKYKWDMLIEGTEQAQKKTLATMLQLRKEIVSMFKLKAQYPNSDTINGRLQKCDHLLKESSEILESMKKELSGFKQQREALNKLIEECNESIKSEPNGYR